MDLDLGRFRAKLIANHAALIEQDRLAEADRPPVTLDQDGVGRLSRIDAMQVQAMALAHTFMSAICIAATVIFWLPQ